jgi:hypothetical protein
MRRVFEMVLVAAMLAGMSSASWGASSRSARCVEMLSLVQALADGMRNVSNIGSLDALVTVPDVLTGPEREAMERLNETHKKVMPLVKLYAVDAQTAATALRECSLQ